MGKTIVYRGTVRAILSDPPCKDGNARFTTMPWKTFSDQVLTNINVFVS